MTVLLLDLPAMYGDHHVTEVRRILLDLDGVQDVYASSGFRVVEITYNSKKITKKVIKAKLDEAGYNEDLAITLESSIPVNEREGEKYYRRTSSYAQTQNTIGFEQGVHYEGRAQWPCPGMGLLEVAITQTEEANNG
ncbi:MAG: heavy-metal-associated domain-containing protein [Chloroflexota bacterium]|nr:heavy-metal-associated domain-containing protein [Chloroflexota bacterium]